jgi:hypothetical protein
MEEQYYTRIARMCGTISPGDRLIVLLFEGNSSCLGHINNLHNTTFWALVDKGMTEREATKRLEV